jgi:hypothetical protein
VVGSCTANSEPCQFPPPQLIKCIKMCCRLQPVAEATEEAVPKEYDLALIDSVQEYGSTGPAAVSTTAVTSKHTEAGMKPRPPSTARGDSGSSRAASVHSKAAWAGPFSSLAPAPSMPVLHDSLTTFADPVTQPQGAKEPSWVVRGVFLTHKYTDPTPVDITVTNAGGWGSSAAGCDAPRTSEVQTPYTQHL